MQKTPSLLQSFIPVIVLTFFLGINVFLFDDVIGGPTQVALMIGSLVASIITIRNGNKWIAIQEAFLKTINTSMSSIMILLLIGSLAGTWMISGVVPFLIYYGLDILHPSIFLCATVIICSVVSLFTGSSWSTIATIGIALLGVGKTLGFDPSLVAGAIISGAYFGDKMSPLSDTTNLSPAMVGIDIFKHIKYMMNTTVPTYALTLAIFIVWGLMIDVQGNVANVVEMQKVIAENYSLNPLLLLVPALLMFIIIKKVPAIPSMFAGVLLGAVFALIFQPQIIEMVAGETGNYLKASYMTVMKAVFGDVSISTGTPFIDKLFSTGGMAGMLNTVWLILMAMVFGGTMEAGGFLLKITSSLLKYVKTSTSLVATTVSYYCFNRLYV
jgi:NhaC family Na+:H+ antiporter